MPRYRGQIFEVGSRNAEVGIWNTEVGILKLEVGPVVVPKEWDYAAASVRNAEGLRHRAESIAHSVKLYGRGKGIVIG